MITWANVELSINLFLYTLLIYSLLIYLGYAEEDNRVS